MTTKIEKKTGIILNRLNTKCLILIIALIAVMLTACKDDDDEDEPKYTGVTLGGAIPVYAEVGVNFELAKSLAEGVISDTFDGFGGGAAQDDFVGKVDIIYLDNNVNIYKYDTEGEKKVLRLSPTNDPNTYILQVMLMVLNGNIKIPSFAHLPSPDTIRLANSNWLNTVGIKQT